MRIAYFVHLNVGPDSGVFKKIAAQISQWRQLGHSVGVFAVTRNPVLREQLKTFRFFEDRELELYSGSRLAGMASRFKAFTTLTRRVLDWQPDIVYARNDLWYPAVSNMARCSPLVIEVNSDDVGELKCQSTVHAMYNGATRNRLYSAAKALVFVCRELAMTPHFAKYRKPYLVLGNGASLANISPLPVRSSSAPVRLVFVGQRDMPWHGLDKIVKMAAIFPEWSFDLVGIEAQDVGRAAPANLVTWGPLQYPEYLPLLLDADCAIGTLALHRKGMQEASPLKTREYLAHGLPVIIGYNDTDFPEGADFLLDLPNIENNVLSNRDRIRMFVESWRGRRVSRSEILHLDTAEKECVRLRFLNQVAQSWFKTDQHMELQPQELLF